MTGTNSDPARPLPNADRLPDILGPGVTPQHCTLTFPLVRVLAAAEHALAAPAHKRLYGETNPTPALWWVKDDGTYLMSNGYDPEDTRDRDSGGLLPHVVHAHGWGPGTDARSILGGGDFAERIDLDAPTSIGGTLLGGLRGAVAAGATRFRLTVIPEGEDMLIAMATE
ncbi:DUF3085 domain-containing protein [Streptomyces sp. NPDC059506]|uniref:DUF3085 domain-containing protein n=1 Tax=Streptomyces sp. NPDC059506 TaxID=3347751 RepID=UPI003695B7C9